jgi:8-oxo-dGTP pyrophosphatase MutT (NUDIX family)
MSRDPEMPNSLSQVIIRHALHTYWRFARGLTMGVRGAVLDEKDRIFLIRHTYVPGWHLPGGGVEPRESALDALARELSEEARIALDGPPRLHGVFFNAGLSRRDHVVVYVVRDFIQIEEKRPDREIAAAGFFSVDALPEGTTAATRRRLAEIASGSPPSTTW